MEFVSGTLSGILLWLFILHCVWSARKNARDHGGELLLAVERPPRSVLKKIGLFIALAFPLAFYFLLFVLLYNGAYTWKPLNYSIAALQLFQVIQFSTHSIVAWLKVLLEIRRKGIVVNLRFWPWDRIKYCRPARYYDGVEFCVQGGFERKIYALVPKEQRDTVIEAVAPYVEIHDYYNELVSKPSPQTTAEDSTAQPAEKPKIKYSFLQYDLRTLLLLALVVASFSSWYGILFRRSEETVNQISRLEAKFEGVECREYGKGLTSLNFSKCKKELTDADLVELVNCTQLDMLVLPKCSITDAGLTNLQGLKELSFLSIESEKVTDAGLAHLEGLTKIHYLSISGNHITDAGLAHLKGLKNLRTLYLFHTGVTSEGVRKLKKELPNAEILN
jgi:hypothetical protein